MGWKKGNIWIFLRFMDIGYRVILISGEPCVTMIYYSEEELMEVK